MYIKNAFCRRGEHRRSFHDRTFPILLPLRVTLSPWTRRHRCSRTSLFSVPIPSHPVLPRLAETLSASPFARAHGPAVCSIRVLASCSFFPFLPPLLFTPSHPFFQSTPSPGVDTFPIYRSRTKYSTPTYPLQLLVYTRTTQITRSSLLRRKSGDISITHLGRRRWPSTLLQLPVESMVANMTKSGLWPRNRSWVPTKEGA